MHRTPTRRISPLACATLALVAGTLAGLATPALAQRATPAATPPGASRSVPRFDEVALTDPVQAGDLVLVGDLVHVWSDGRTTRAFAAGAVRVRLGGYEFDAQGASVWAAPVERGGRRLLQVAVDVRSFSQAPKGGAQGDRTQSGERLLITSVIEGTLRVRTDALVRTPSEDPRVVLGEGALDRYLARLTGASVPAEASQGAPARFPAPRLPEGEAPSATRVGPVRQRPTTTTGGAGPGIPDAGGGGNGQVVDPAGLTPPALPPDAGGAYDEPARIELMRPEQGTLSWALGRGGEATLTSLDPENPDAENVLLLTGGVVVQYNEAQSVRTVQISAQRAVVFLGPGSVMDLARAEGDQVRGIYLEGDVVATDGSYNLRGPRVYYDTQAGEALMIDAVFWTYDERRDLPLYMRADAIRQEASNRFSARNARLTTSAFHDPHFSIGAGSVTITRPERADGLSSTLVNVRHLTLRAADVPVAYFPLYIGDVENPPLRAIGVESGSGGAVKTSWDAFSLFGLRRPDDLLLDLIVDGYFDRGAAVGTDIAWNTGDAFGSFFAYMLIDDEGTDELTSGAEIDQDGRTRGIILGEHRWNLDEKWTLAFEGAYISDETFVDAFFEPFAESRREFTTSAYARRLEDNTSLSLLAKTNLNDFVSNEYLLQSQGYSVQKAPEIGYARLADEFLDGRLYYSSETTLSSMQIEFTERTPAELGFNTVARARAAFGLGPDDSIGQALRDRGFSDDNVLRFDTRHEVSAPMNLGPIRVEPFAVGRVTAYDQDFESHNGDNDDTTRLWGSIGARASTSFVRVYDDAESRLLGIHRLRHIIEPSVTAWVAGTNISQTELPVYDSEVESLADATVLRFSLDQTFQTQRGGPGRWRSVDLFKLRTEFVTSSDNADRESPIDRYFDYRPEYSLLGDFFVVDTSWQMTDAVAISQHLTFDLDTNQIARFSAGALFEHSQAVTSFIEARTINALDVTYLDAGINYKLTEKYDLGATATYDTDEGDFQNLGVRLQRRFPNATFGINARFNNITGRSSFGLIFQPAGAPSRSAQRLDRLGAGSR